MSGALFLARTLQIFAQSFHKLRLQMSSVRRLLNVRLCIAGDQKGGNTGLDNQSKPDLRFLRSSYEQIFDI